MAYTGASGEDPVELATGAGSTLTGLELDEGPVGDGAEGADGVVALMGGGARPGWSVTPQLGLDSRQSKDKQRSSRSHLRFVNIWERQRMVGFSPPR